jgi:hypothetical protein
MQDIGSFEAIWNSIVGRWDRIQTSRIFNNLGEFIIAWNNASLIGLLPPSLLHETAVLSNPHATTP